MANAIKGRLQTLFTDKNKRKGVWITIIAGVLVIATAISCTISNRKKKTSSSTPTDVSITSDTSGIGTTDLNNLGTELEFETEYKPEYGKVTGNVDKDKTVEKDGTYYADKEFADKSNKVGSTSIDTKNNTLVVKPNGTVVEKNPGYEVKDENGKVVDSGEGSAPDNFEYNENLGGSYEKEDQTSNLVRVDKNYYNEEGNLVLEKGMFVSKDTLEYAKKNLSTTPNKTAFTPSNNETSSNVSSRPTTNETTSKEETSSTTSKPQDKGVENADGTYTIDGITYLSKADYEQCIIDGYEGYAIIDGIMQPIANFQTEKQLVK